jgi:hypothetical protein
MNEETRLLVWERAESRCEYCLIAQEHAEVRHHVEHVVARKHGGDDDPSNLCLACARCNLLKGSDLTGIDPETGGIERLFNPRLDRWEEHFLLIGPMITGLTPTGRATVRLMAMNAGQRLQLRAVLIAEGLFPGLAHPNG